MLFDSYDGFIFYDGAMGTMLQKSLKNPGDRPDILSITNPGAVEEIHRMYIDAGSDIVCTNTFGANSDSLRGTGYTPADVIFPAVAAAKRASRGRAKVALDIGPTGQLLEPLGDLKPDRAYELFKEQAIAGEKAGADFAAIETMSDPEELKAAMLAVSENTGLPILATMTFDKTGHTYTGFAAESFADLARGLGAAAAGINCSYGPSEMYETARRIAKESGLPLIVKLNAGLPDSKTGIYSTGPAEFARLMLPYAEIGARIVGGCCGTTPDYIRELKLLMTGSP